MIKYSGSTIEDWFYSETNINKMYYNGRVTFLKLKEEEPDYKFIGQYSDGTSYSAECDGSTALTESTITAHTTSKSAMTRAYVYTCGYDTFKIDSDAFNGCTSLSSITLDEKITVIGSQAFFRCSGLTSFHFPSGLTTIEGACFRLANKIKNINGIPSGVTYISSGAFADMSGLTGATIPASVTGTSTNLFLRDTALKEVHFKRRTAPALGSDAFKDCSALVKIYIPDCDCYNSYAAQSQFSGKTSIIYGENGTKCYKPPHVYFNKYNGSYQHGGFSYTANTDNNLVTIRKTASSSGDLSTCHIAVSGVTSVKFTQVNAFSGSGLYYSATIGSNTVTGYTNSTGAVQNFTGLTKTTTYIISVTLRKKTQGSSISGTNASADITWTQ